MPNYAKKKSPKFATRFAIKLRHLDDNVNTK